MKRVRISRFCNALFRGHPEEMLCARVYLMHKKEKGKWTKIMWFLDFVFYALLRETDHCRRCYLWQEKQRKHEQ